MYHRVGFTAAHFTKLAQWEQGLAPERYRHAQNVVSKSHIGTTAYPRDDAGSNTSPTDLYAGLRYRPLEGNLAFDFRGRRSNRAARTTGANAYASVRLKQIEMGSAEPYLAI